MYCVIFFTGTSPISNFQSSIFLSFLNEISTRYTAGSLQKKLHMVDAKHVRMFRCTVPSKVYTVWWCGAVLQTHTDAVVAHTIQKSNKNQTCSILWRILVTQQLYRY